MSDVYVDSGGQQLLKLWTEFQHAEKLHSERIRDMDERLKRVGSSSSSSKWQSENIKLTEIGKWYDRAKFYALLNSNKQFALELRWQMIAHVMVV